MISSIEVKIKACVIHRVGNKLRAEFNLQMQQNSD